MKTVFHQETRSRRRGLEWVASRQSAVHPQLVGGTETRSPALWRWWSHEEDREVSLISGTVFGVSLGKSAQRGRIQAGPVRRLPGEASLDLVLSSGQFCSLPSCGQLASGDTLGGQALGWGSEVGDPAGMSWVEDRDAAKCQMHRTAPQQSLTWSKMSVVPGWKALQRASN